MQGVPQKSQDSKFKNFNVGNPDAKLAKPSDKSSVMVGQGTRDHGKLAQFLIWCVRWLQPEQRKRYDQAAEAFFSTIKDVYGEFGSGISTYLETEFRKGHALGSPLSQGRATQILDDADKVNELLSSSYNRVSENLSLTHEGDEAIQHAIKQCLNNFVKNLPHQSNEQLGNTIEGFIKNFSEFLEKCSEQFERTETTSSLRLERTQFFIHAVDFAGRTAQASKSESKTTSELFFQVFKLAIDFRSTILNSENGDEGTKELIRSESFEKLLFAQILHPSFVQSLSTSKNRESTSKAIAERMKHLIVLLKIVNDKKICLTNTEPLTMENLQSARSPLKRALDALEIGGLSKRRAKKIEFLKLALQILFNIKYSDRDDLSIEIEEKIAQISDGLFRSKRE